jgi:hypothetical protein
MIAIPNFSEMMCSNLGTVHFRIDCDSASTGTVLLLYLSKWKTEVLKGEKNQCNINSAFFVMAMPGSGSGSFYLGKLLF